MPPSLHVGIDVGGMNHRVAVGLSDGKLIDEFDVPHTHAGFNAFFERIGALQKTHTLPVVIAMEGFNGCARPLDREIQARGYPLYSVNNLKLARYKEIFPAPAKTDAIDARRILELIRLSRCLPVARDALQEVAAVPLENDKLKRLTRRRRQLVNERVAIVNRMHTDLRAVCPELLALTPKVDNVWFLNFITCREQLPKLIGLRKATLLALPQIGEVYASRIQVWQRSARFAPEVEWMGGMIIEDARRILALCADIKALDRAIGAITQDSELAKRIGTIRRIRQDLAGGAGG